MVPLEGLAVPPNPHIKLNNVSNGWRETLKYLSRSNSVFDRILQLCFIASGFLIIIVILLTGYEVMMRYVFGIGEAWVTEIINNLLLFVAFLGAAWVQKIRGHVAIDLIYLHQKPKTQIIFDIVVAIIGIISCLVMTYYSGETAVDNLLRGIKEYTTVRAPRGLIIGIMPVGFFLLSIEFIRQAQTHIKRLVNPDKLEKNEQSTRSY